MLGSPPFGYKNFDHIPSLLLLEKTVEMDDEVDSIVLLPF